MALSDSLKASKIQRPGPACRFRTIANGLDETDRQALDEAVETVRLHRITGGPKTMSWLHRVLNDEGFEIGIHTVQRHINQICSCGANDGAI